VREIIESWSGSRLKADVVDAFVAARVPCGVVRHGWEIVDDDVARTGAYSEADDGFGGTVTLAASPFGYDTAGQRIPRLGGDNDAVLSWLESRRRG